MKKTTRNILIMLAVLVYWAARLRPCCSHSPRSRRNPLRPHPPPVTEKVMEKSTRDVSVIKVENAGGSYQLTPIEEPETETSASSETDSSSSESEKDVAFTVKGLEDYDVNTVDSSSAARSVLDVNASKNLGEVTNLGGISAFPGTARPKSRSNIKPAAPIPW